jgi:hypothetical protein
MGVASCRSIFLLSNVVFNRTSASFWFSIHDFLSIGGRACSGFPARGPARPLARTPGAPPPPCTPTSLYLIFFSRATTPSPFLPPLFHLLCPRCDPVDGYRRLLDPKVSSPSTLPPSPSLSLGAWTPAPAPQCADPRPLPLRCVAPAVPLPPPLSAAPVRPLPHRRAALVALGVAPSRAALAAPARLPVRHPVRPLPRLRAALCPPPAWLPRAPPAARPTQPRARAALARNI